MRKIDLHIHTTATRSDSGFVFSIEKLKEYVELFRLDCIAITNHNLFDLEQFVSIAAGININVLPGIEINLEKGHLLLISEHSELEDFFSKCNQINNLVTNSEEYISVGNLKEIYVDLNRYLLIPHYDKKPIVSSKVIEELKDYISAGEVTSFKKFKYCINDRQSLVPVLFSDLRITDNMPKFSPKQTYINIEDISLRGIKNCLLDKNKVFLSEKDGHNLFQAFEDGQVLSNGLNVILGERSSGKTYTLKTLCNTFENLKHIKQFELIETDEEKDIENFNDLLSVKQSSLSEAYLKEFKEVVEDILLIDRKENEIEVKDFIDSLLKVAFEEERKDAFSNAVLFYENPYSEFESSNLKKLISSVEQLIINEEFRDIIEIHISKERLTALILDLMHKFNEFQELNLKKRWINSLITNIKSELQSNTSSSTIEYVDFYKILIDNEKLQTFSKVCNLVKREKTIECSNVRRFQIVANTKKYSGANELLKKSGKKMVFSEAFVKYDNPIEFLESLKLITMLKETEYYKYFVNIEYKILNEYGTEVSGGERSEFNLLQKIKDAHHYDMLLIDEPESSFDNLFLKNEVNELIKEIARSIPVVIVTHNNTVGASIKPDYILYTKKEIINKKPFYKVFSGYPSDIILKSITGETISNFNILLNCLEAGKEAYNERGKSYEILKN